ncbi:MAG: acylneuraminate cytidylyltransferase family protein [Candidatus Pacebacteria bacterium]|nr:acylneuraminate cytidylyltransferase family protein [Candidatus Paceibacterota bacterium]
MKKVLCLITARGGSKSIPRKNIKPFAGKPLIAWSIETAIKSGLVDRTVVTTDDQEIADISKQHGAEVPFMRPAELALDTTPSLPVLQHAVQWLKDNENYYPDYVLLLEPTSPARRPFHVKAAIEIAEKSGCDSVIALGAVPGHYNYHWQVALEDDKALLVTGTAWPQVIPRRQELPKTYFRNGAFYLFRPDLLFAEKPSLYGSDVRGYVVEDKYSVDIDIARDWDEAEPKFLNILAEER